MLLAQNIRRQMVCGLNERWIGMNVEKIGDNIFQSSIPIIYYLFILTANGFLPGSSGTTIRHNIQITHVTQNNTPSSNKTQHTKLHKQ
jgi:hypothetical protein